MEFSSLLEKNYTDNNEADAETDKGAEVGAQDAAYDAQDIAHQREIAHGQRLADRARFLNVGKEEDAGSAQGFNVKPPIKLCLFGVASL